MGFRTGYCSIAPCCPTARCLERIASNVKGVQKQFEELLRRECEATPVVALDELKRLIDEGANATKQVGKTKFGNFLQLAAYHGKLELVQWLRSIDSLSETQRCKVLHLIAHIVLIIFS
jgi:hypothetical protein